MGAKIRTILTGLISLAVLLTIFLLYIRTSKTPPMDIIAAPDSNVAEFEDVIGKIGEVGIVALKKPKFMHRNKDREIDREFGFQKLLHQVKGRWEVEKPYLNIYQDSFRCYIMADKGTVQVETAVGRPAPKDAAFTGKVVFHILPQAGSDIKESFIYLDDLSFISDKTLFSSQGPVKFVSQDAEMLGTGLELVYNDQLERLEFLQIIDLDSLRLKSSKATPLSSRPAQIKKPASISTTKTLQPGQSASSQKSTTLPKAPTQIAKKKRQGEYYKCIFSKNVVIDTPEQLVFVDDEISINDIFWAKASGDESTVPKVTDTNNVKISDAAVTRRSEPNKVPSRPENILVSCDDGVVILPTSSPRIGKRSAQGDSRQSKADTIGGKKLEDTGGRTTFITERIDYEASTGDVVATGRSKLTFYTSDILGAEANEPPIPVKIIAQKGAKFLRSSNQAIFEGDCVCSMLKLDPNRPERYTLLAPKLTVNLSGGREKRKDTQSSTSTTGIERFTATGGVVIEVTPLDPGGLVKGAAKLTPEKAAADKPDSNEPNDSALRARFVAPRIDYRASTNDIVAPGPTEFMFYTDDIMDTNSTRASVPVKVTAQKQTKYFLGSNQAVFEGDCLCSMVREDTNGQQKYTLSGPKLTIDLSRATNKQAFASTADIKHLTVTGGVVRLATVKTAEGKLLSGMELKCRQFDYDDAQQLLWAAGPGVIKLNNFVVSEPNDRSGRFSLRRPCWALFEDFDSLKYYLDRNRIVANAKTSKIKIGYVPIIKGGYGQPVRATAGQVVAQLYQTPHGQTELSTLTASSGITYEDQKNQFAGSDMFYEHQKAMMKIKGDKTQPCIFNGVLVDSIEYDLKTGKVKAQIAAPGALQIK